jgi:ribosome-associated translation inhibitor RaiA
VFKSFKSKELYIKRMEINMIIEVFSKNLTISPGSRNLVAAYNLSLKKYFKRIYSIRWSFEAVKKTIETRLYVHAYSGEYRATATGSTIREVLVTACDTVERQRRRRKRIIESARRKSTRKPADSSKTRNHQKKLLTPEDFGV